MPWLAIGHSMGGCLTLLALANGERRFAGAVLSAPMLGLQFGKFSPVIAQALMRLNLALGRSGRYVLGQPGQPFDDAFDTNVLTHDPRRFARYRAQVRANPDLALGAPTWGWLDFAFRATGFLASSARLRTVTIPVEIVSAADDRLVDNAAQAAAARNLPQGRLITVPGAYHEILMETDDMRNFFLRVFDALTGKTAPQPAEAAKPTLAAPIAAAPESAPVPEPMPLPEPVAVPVSTPATTKPTSAKGKSSPPKASPAKAVAKKTPPKAAAKPVAATPPAAKPASAKVAPPKSAAKAPAKTPAKVAAVKPAAKAAAKPPAAKKAPAAKAAPKKTAKPKA
jgi:lysophospholipase